MTRDQVVALGVAALLLGAVFIFPYTRYGVVQVNPAIPGLTKQLVREGLRPVWLPVDPMPGKYWSRPLGIVWPIVYTMAVGDVVLFGATILMLRGRRGRGPDSATLAIGLLGLSLYFMACATPAVDFGDGDLGGDTPRVGAPPGLFALLLGWIPPLVIPWLANPIWLIGMIGLLCLRYTAAWRCGVAASLLGLTTLYFFPPAAGFEVLPRDRWVSIDSDRAGALPGFYLWQSSLVSLALAARVGLAAGGISSTRGKGPPVDDLHG